MSSQQAPIFGTGWQGCPPSDSYQIDGLLPLDAAGADFASGRRMGIARVSAVPCPAGLAMEMAPPSAWELAMVLKTAFKDTDLADFPVRKPRAEVA